MLTAEKMRNVLYLLDMLKKREACFAEALSAIVTWEVEVNIDEEIMGIIKTLLPAEIWEVLNYYVVESKKNGQIAKGGEIIKLTNDDEFIEYLISQGLISN